MKPNREKITHDNNSKKHFTRETVLTAALNGKIKFRWFPKGPEEGPSRPVNIRGLWSSDVTNFAMLLAHSGDFGGKQFHW